VHGCVCMGECVCVVCVCVCVVGWVGRWVGGWVYGRVSRVNGGSGGLVL